MPWSDDRFREYILRHANPDIVYLLLFTPMSIQKHGKTMELRDIARQLKDFFYKMYVGENNDS